MDFSRGFNIHLATLFGIGKIPGGGTWASLIVLLIALYENNAGTASFLAFLSIIIGPKAYKKLVSVVDTEDPKEFVLDEVIGMGIAISGVYIFSRLINEFSFNIFSDYTSLSDIGNLFILTFIVFRFFDISKIGPVGWVEKNSNEKAYNKVIGDDIVAAILSILIVIIILSINLWVL